jgi:acetylornithine deacetylase/succinyl-diaminopimelate desuccinylase-like protein
VHPARARTDSPDPVELLRELIRFDTSNPPGNERPCIEYVADVLRGSGVEPLIVGDPERPNLVARLAGTGESPPLLLYGHVDVVPADPAEWQHDPFAADLVDGVVWGRGALDMKAGVAMLVSAFLRGTGEPPPADLILTLASDEEAGSRLGAKLLVEEHAELFDGVRFALSEIGGFTEWVGGRRLYPIQVAEKQRCLIRATIHGAGGHPSTVVRDTAASNLGKLLTRLDKRRLPVHLTPVVREMLAAMAGALPLHERLALRPLTMPALTDRILDLFGKDAESLDPLLHNTATPTFVRGGDSSNVVPTEIVVEFDGRVLPGHTPQDLVSELEGLLDGPVDLELIDAEPASRPDPDLTLYQMLADVLREHDPGGTPMPTLIPGYTDARYFAQLGIQTYGFLPMRLPKQITTALIHAPDERIPAEAVEFGADCVYDAIRRYTVFHRHQIHC